MAKPTRILLVVIAAACVAASAIMLAGCNGVNEENQVKFTVSQELDQFKNLDDATAEEIADSWNNDDDDRAFFAMMGIDPNEFVQVIFDGFDYEITDVAVNDDDTAAVTAVCTMKSWNELASVIEYAAWEYTMSGFSLSAYGQAMMDGIENIEPSQTDPVTFHLQKDPEGTWTIDDDSEFQSLFEMPEE